MGGGGRRWIWMIAALLSLALLVGCGGDDDGESDGGEDVVTVSGDETEATDETGAETATSEEEEAPEDSEDAIASRDGSVDGVATRLDIVEFKRSDATVELTIRLSLLPAGEGLSAQVADTFDNGTESTTPAEAIEEDTRTMDGISLIDGVNAKRHLVARDEAGDCVCDGDLSGTFIKEDAPVVLSATFGAPPEDVESLDVQIPSFGTFTDVPLE